MTTPVDEHLDISAIDLARHDIVQAKQLRRLNLLQQLSVLHKAITLPSDPLTDEQVELADWYYPNAASWFDGDWRDYNGLDLSEHVRNRVEHLISLELFDDYELWWDANAPDDGTILIGVMNTAAYDEVYYHIIDWWCAGAEVKTLAALALLRAAHDAQRVQHTEDLRAKHIRSCLTRTALAAGLILLIILLQRLFPHDI